MLSQGACKESTFFVLGNCEPLTAARMFEFLRKFIKYYNRNGDMIPFDISNLQVILWGLVAMFAN